MHRMQTVDATHGSPGVRALPGRGRALATRPLAVYPPATAVWRARVGLEVPALPPHAADCADPLEPEALAPLIATPCEGQVFARAGDAAAIAVRVLGVQPDRDVRLLLDGELVARVRPGSARTVRVPAGRHALTALSERGHAHTVNLVVR